MFTFGPVICMENITALQHLEAGGGWGPHSYNLLHANGQVAT